MQLVLDADLALLQVDLKEHPCVLFSQEYTPFDHLYSYGYPDNRPSGDPATFTLEGKAGNQEVQLKFKAGQVRPGLSGAPILNVRTGCVCGVVERTRDRASDLGGRAISATTVFQVFPELEALQRLFHRKDQRWANCLWEYPARTQQGQNRQRMLKKVRAFWITGVLEQSLHDAVLILLGLSEQPETIENPWRLVVQESDRPEQILQLDTTITQVYDHSNGELLILGEPGCGKTTLLLELARDLLVRARLDSSHLMPVVFNLSSWAVKRPPLTEWLIEELNLKYQVPRKLGKVWIESDQVLPLLDGLDEVTLASRAACVEAINRYRQEHGSVPTVVCSRSADYLAQTAHLQLHRAVVVQPLTTQQINEYLESAGPHLAKLRVARLKDPVLQELIATPLMLSVLTLAYHDISFEEILTTGTLERRRQQVFATYVQQMFQRRGSKANYTPQQTMQWLGWLARQMARHGQTEFYLERMQPSWLQDSRYNRPLYPNRTAIELSTPQAIGLIDRSISQRIKPSTMHSTYTRVVRLNQALAGLLIPGLISVLITVLVVTPIFGLPQGIAYGQLLGLISGLVGLFIGLTRRIEADIKPAEVVTWSWRDMKQAVVKNFLSKPISRIRQLSQVVEDLLPKTSTLIVLVLMGIVTGAPIFLIILIILIFFFIVISLLLFPFEVFNELSSGLSNATLDKKSLTRPNQGIWRSAWNSSLVGLLFGPVVGLSIGLLIGWPVFLISPGGLLLVLLIVLPTGLIKGLTVGLSNGGIACIQHFVLRWLLWHTGYAPWNYSRFLDYAAERILLRKVGGGYIFIHRQLRDYFASLEKIKLDSIDNGNADLKTLEEFNNEDADIEEERPGPQIPVSGNGVHGPSGVYIRAALDHLAAGRIEPAYAAVQQAYVAEPNNALVHKIFGQVFARRRPPTPDLAIQAYNRSLKNNPDDAETHKLVGDVFLYLRKQPIQAIHPYIQSLRLNATDFETHLCLAKCYESTNQLKAALREYQEGVRLLPAGFKGLQPHFDLGQIAFHMNQLPIAEQAFVKALTLNPAFHDARFLLSQVYEHEGKLADALRECGYVVQAVPTNQAAQEMLQRLVSKMRRSR